MKVILTSADLNDLFHIDLTLASEWERLSPSSLVFRYGTVELIQRADFVAFEHHIDGQKFWKVLKDRDDEFNGTFNYFYPLMKVTA